MAEFVKVMKDWRRMCKAMEAQYGYDGSCKNCVLEGCAAVYEQQDTEDYVDMERKIAKWAAEHQEPVYPTWEEWLQSVGVMESSQGLIRRIQSQLLIDGIPAHAIPTRKVLEPIPADIAEKLGIEPKEVV